MPRILTNDDVAEFQERLLDAATRRFLKHGYAGVTLRRLAEDLGCSPMTPYRYFANKDAILAAIRTRAYARFADALHTARAAHDAPLDRSAAVGRAYLDFALAEPEAYRIMFELDRADDASYPEARAEAERARAEMTAHVKDLIAAGIVDGDPDVLGHVFWAAVHGIVVLHMSGKLDSELDPETLYAHTARLLFLGAEADKGATKKRP